jgi:hypothetical protein
MALAGTETLKLPESGIRGAFRSVITSATCSLNFTVLNNINQGSQPADPASILCAARMPNFRTEIMIHKQKNGKKYIQKSTSYCGLKQHSVNYERKKVSSNTEFV